MPLFILEGFGPSLVLALLQEHWIAALELQFCSMSGLRKRANSVDCRGIIPTSP